MCDDKRLISSGIYVAALIIRGRRMPARITGCSSSSTARKFGRVRGPRMAPQKPPGALLKTAPQARASSTAAETAAASLQQLLVRTRPSGRGGLLSFVEVRGRCCLRNFCARRRVGLSAPPRRPPIRAMLRYAKRFVLLAIVLRRCGPFPPHFGFHHFLGSLARLAPDTLRHMFGHGGGGGGMPQGGPGGRGMPQFPGGGGSFQVTELTARRTTHVVSASAQQQLQALRTRAEEMVSQQAQAAGAAATFEERLRAKEAQLRVAEDELRAAQAEVRYLLLLLLCREL